MNSTVSGIWMVGVVALAACSGGGESGSTTSSTAAAAPSTAAAAPSTSGVEPPREPIEWAIVDQPGPGVVVFDVSDATRRNITWDPGFVEWPPGSTEPSTGQATTLDIRRIAVTVSIARAADGTPDLVQPHPLLLKGGYRHGTEVMPCEVERADVTTVCIGFPGTTVDGPSDPWDAANMPADVSIVLDIVLANPSTFGAVDSEHIVYTGDSFAGMVGLWSIHPLAQDDRLTAIAVTGGAAPYWLSAFGNHANWDYGPNILLVNGTEDTLVTYAVARKTWEAARAATNLRFVTVIGASHEEPFLGCDAASGYAAAWVEHELTGAPLPSDDLVTDSGCSVFGSIDGGTLGPGVLASLMRD